MAPAWCLPVMRLIVILNYSLNNCMIMPLIRIKCYINATLGVSLMQHWYAFSAWLGQHQVKH